MRAMSSAQRCVVAHTSRASDAAMTSTTSQRKRPSLSGRDHATAIGTRPFAAKNAGAADTAIG